MAVLVVAVCVIATQVLAPGELTRIGYYGLASNFFGMNIAAARRGGNYFDSGLRDSPFLHLWSLGIEEQFYIVWPLLLGPIAMLARRWLHLTARRFYVFLFVPLTIVSIVASIVLTRRSPLWGFYSLPARMYEFAIGAACAVLFAAPVRSVWQRPLCWIGCGLLVASLKFTAINVGFPGAWPLLPTGGAALIIVSTSTGGTGSLGAVRRVLESVPARLISRYSYAWYLWHWPAFILVLAATNGSQNAARLATIASIVPAAASFHVIEQPVRYARRLIISPARSFLAGAAWLGLGALACVGVFVWGHHRERDPRIVELMSTEESFRASGCSNSSLGGFPVCRGGSDVAGAPVVLLAGDSHAAQWVSAFSKAGKTNGFAVVLRTYGNCPAVPFLQAPPLVANPRVAGCWDYQRATKRMVEKGLVDIAVVADAGSSRRRHITTDDWFESSKGFGLAARSASIPVGLLVDNPLSNDPGRCIARGFSVRRCELNRSAALVDIRRYAPLERALVEVGMDRIDLTDRMCPSDPCPLKVNGIWVAARANHLSRAFTESLSDQIGSEVRRLRLRRVP